MDHFMQENGYVNYCNDDHPADSPPSDTLSQVYILITDCRMSWGYIAEIVDHPPLSSCRRQSTTLDQVFVSCHLQR